MKPKMNAKMTLSDLAARTCRPLPARTPALKAQQVADGLKVLRGWSTDGEAIEKTFKFDNYHQTMAFVNAVAWIAHQQDHHPDLAVGYNRCTVKFSTHSVGGLSENDLSCAAKVEGLGKL